MMKTTLASMSCCLALGLAGCATDAGDSDDDDPATSEAKQDVTIGGWAGCTVTASISQQNRNGFGEISCGDTKASLEIYVCLNQLVTGGWQTLNWSCTDIHYLNAHYVYAWTAAVPYWTTNRWYNTQVWVNVNNTGWGYQTSEGLKGP
jgi:hypothetical protein